MSNGGLDPQCVPDGCCNLGWLSLSSCGQYEPMPLCPWLDSRGCTNDILALPNGSFEIHEFLDFLRLSQCRGRQRVEVLEETSSRKAGGAKVPFHNFDPENYFGNAGLRIPATRCTSPFTGVTSVENALRGDFDLRLKHLHNITRSVFVAFMDLVIGWRCSSP